MGKYYIETLPFSIHKKTGYKFDDDGILLSKIAYTQEYKHHLTSIASYVIETGNKANLSWIIKNLDSEGVYWHDFKFPYYKNFPQLWVGGLSQGLAISALARNGEMKLAKKAAEGMKKYCLNEKSVIYEYPYIEILNGWIYSLFGLYDIGDMGTFNKSLEALIKRLDFYITKNYLIYDFTGIPSTEFYHVVVTKQLKALYYITGDMRLNDAWAKLMLIDPNNKIAKFVRMKMIIKKNGLLGTYKKYKQMKKWKK